MDACRYPMVPGYGTPPLYGTPPMPGYAPMQGPMLGQPIPYAQPLPREATELPPFPPERPRPGLGRGLFKGLFGRSRKEYLLTQQMYQVLGQRVKVATYTGELDGEIAGVYPDHLLVSKEEQKYYIRWDAIVYVAPVEEL